MYDPTVTQLQIERVEAGMNIRLHRYAPDKIADVVARLEDVNSKPKNKQRKLTVEENEFIRNEQLLSKLAWNHCAAN